MRPGLEGSTTYDAMARFMCFVAMDMGLTI